MACSQNLSTQYPRWYSPAGSSGPQAQSAGTWRWPVPRIAPSGPSPPLYRVGWATENTIMSWSADCTGGWQKHQISFSVGPKMSDTIPHFFFISYTKGTSARSARESHFGGLTRQVGRRMFHGFQGGVPRWFQRRYLDSVRGRIERFVTDVEVEVFDALSESSNRLVADLSLFFNRDTGRHDKLRLCVARVTHLCVPGKQSTKTLQSGFFHFVPHFCVPEEESAVTFGCVSLCKSFCRRLDLLWLWASCVLILLPCIPGSK